MYRIRFHGRGGQGMKTASRVLGSAFFRAGFEVQDAPRYGAERRGAPVFAYVRADRRPIDERGVPSPTSSWSPTTRWWAWPRPECSRGSTRTRCC
jgi:2-oxoacid:acceptor oxidoreductase gamma subunit (pyruvate/2-ketoisovalerate family)